MCPEIELVQAGSINLAQAGSIKKCSHVRGHFLSSYFWILYLGLPEIVLVAVLVSCDQLLAFSKYELCFRSITRLQLFELDAF